MKRQQKENTWDQKSLDSCQIQTQIISQLVKSFVLLHLTRLKRSDKDIATG